MTAAELERFMAKVQPEPNTGCWLWEGASSTKGYGQLRLRGRAHAAHRLSYSHFRGPIGKGLLACHRCDTPSCVNPGHIFLGTAAENTADMFSKGRARPGRGQRHAKALLNRELVIRIRRRAASGEALKRIAADIGVSPECISSAVRRRTWKHVEEGSR